MVVAASTASSVQSATSNVSKNPTRVSRPNDAFPNPSRRPLIPSERDNAAVTKRPPSKEISSRYLSFYTSPSSSITSTSYSSNTTTSSSYSTSLRRCPSPLPNHRPSTPSVFPQSATPKRSHSVDRTRPTTPRLDFPNGRGGASLVASNASRVLCTTTRSLSVSFQGESFFYQTSKAKLTSPVPVRKPTPDRRKGCTPVRNSSTSTGEKPSDYHHCWPAARSRHSSLLTNNSDCSSEKDPNLCSVQLLRQSLLLEDGTRRGSFDVADLSISSDTDSLSSGSNPGTPELRIPHRASVSSRPLGIPARLKQETNSRLCSLPQSATPLNSSNTKNYAQPKVPVVRRPSVDGPIPPSRSSSSPLCGPARPSSPSNIAGYPSRGISSPSRARGSSLLSNSSPQGQPPIAPSIISFAAEQRRTKKGESQIEKAHTLRLLYSKHLQWRHVNARTSAVLMVQRVSTENKMYNAWLTNSELHDWVTLEKIKLQLLKQQLKQAHILKGQMIYLEDWFNLERDHSSSLSRATEALKACIICLPVMNGARAELQDVKDAVGSAVDVMQAIGASICSLLSKVEGTSSLVSELTEVVSQEQALLHQSRDLLSTVASLNVKQCSLSGQFLQLKRGPKQM